MKQRSDPPIASGSASICHVGISFDSARIHFEFFKLLGALIFQFVLNRFKFLLNDLLYLRQVLGSNFITGIEDLFIAQFKDDSLLGCFTHLTLKQFLEFLTFLDNRIKFFGNDFVIALLEAGALLFDIAQGVIALGFDLGDLGVDSCRLLTFRNGNFIFNTLERLRACFLINVGNNILSEVQHTVKVTARDIEQHTQIRRDAACIPDMCDGCGKRNVSHALTADSRAGYFDAALIADDSFITGVLVFSAITLPVSLRTENGFTEQTILLRT